MRERALGLAACALAACVAAGCAPQAGARDERLRARIAGLETKRDGLRQRLNDLMARDPRFEGMPRTPVRVALPTGLLRELLQSVVAGFVNQVSLELRDLDVETKGEVRKLVTIGSYRLNVRIDEVHGQLRTSTPDIAFGGDQITLRLPVAVASGEGRATVRFKWSGRNVAGAACGDLDVEQVVTGTVRPGRYRVQGTLQLAATASGIVAVSRFRPIRITVGIDPSPESWAAVRKILEARKTGVCGFVLDRIDVLGIVRGIVEKGFEVRLPTERIRPVAVPVAIEPSMTVGGRTVALAIRLGGIAITPRAVWLGAEVALRTPGAGPAASTGREGSERR